MVQKNRLFRNNYLWPVIITNIVNKVMPNFAKPINVDQGVIEKFDIFCQISF